MGEIATAKELVDYLCAKAREYAELEKTPVLKEMSKSAPGVCAEAVADVVVRMQNWEPPKQPRQGASAKEWDEWNRLNKQGEYMRDALNGLLRAKVPLELRQAEMLCSWLCATDVEPWAFSGKIPMVQLLEELVQRRGGKVTAQLRRGLVKLREILGQYPQRNERKAIESIDAMMGQKRELPLKEGDPWADAALAEWGKMGDAERGAWKELLEQCASAVGTKPAKAWQKRTEPVLGKVSDLPKRAAGWFGLLAASRSDGKPARIDPGNAEVLKGLAWCCGIVAERDAMMAAALQELALAAYRKVPGMGRRCPGVGDGAVWALMRWPVEVAAARLDAIRRQAKNTLVEQRIAASLEALAQQHGMTREQVEELGVPTFGLSAEGTKCEPLGGVTAVLDAQTGEVELRWVNEKGKATKSLPAAVKREQADALARLKQEAKDIGRLIASQRDRLDSLMGMERTWKYAQWHEQYIAHPLVGITARRLIWRIDGVAVLWEKGVWRDVAGKEKAFAKTAEVRLWHPISAGVEEVQQWRQRLHELELVQPFKQAYREVYLLTDAERRTETYSNRFAQHLLRQHQFRALAQGRGWKVGYLGFWDNGGSQVPTKDLPAWGLKAELWVDVANVPEQGNLPGGGAAYIGTDQVRFYPRTLEDAQRYGVGDATEAPMALERVPALALSETMRDVDLFVAVCSVGNDPTWQDRGAGYGQYWNSYSFGELGESAKTRRDALSRIVSRLSINSRCVLTERFLLVRGDLRTYKIHLGSGNILMEPNDQYLCIVPDRSAKSGGGAGNVFLPFEGDTTLSVILSKAFLLAEDTKIKDPTITRQIRPQ